MKTSVGLVTLILLAVLGMLAGIPGCGRRTQTQTTTKGLAVEADPWAKAVASIQKDDLSVADLRRTLETLNADLSNRDDSQRPVSLTPEQSEQYRLLFPGFTPQDWSDVTSPNFSKLDAQYLAECLFFREAVRSLDIADLPVDQKAEIVFAWICRNCYLKSWVENRQGTPTSMPPAAPGYVLRRGWGSPLERAYAFSFACQQLNLDVCFIGTSESAKETWFSQRLTFTAQNAPAGPFWAVGVRHGNDVLVFDTFRGEPVRSADGKGIATLAQLKSQPDLMKAGFRGTAGSLTADMVRNAEVYLALPLQAISPRWARLEKSDSFNLNVSMDPIALMKQYTTTVGTTGITVKSWCPPDGYDLARILANFLPTDEGGRDSGQNGATLFGLWQASQIPPTLFVLPPELKERDARISMFNRFAVIYSNSYLTPPTLREQILRGAFFKVTKDLVEVETRFASGAQQAKQQQTNAEPIREFATKLNDLSYVVSQELSRPAPDQLRIGKARQEIEELFRDRAHQSAISTIINISVGDPGVGEARYLLSLCKTEIAERLTVRYLRQREELRLAQADAKADPAKLAAMKSSVESSRSKAVDAWIGAKDWWDRYESLSERQSAIYPERVAQAAQLSARAARCATGSF